MAKNTLFNFLSQREDTVQLPPGHALILDTNKDNHHYYRIECPIQAKWIIKDKKKEYQLDKHHISVYENEYRDDPKLSQYHYTAEFISQTGKRYRLHVYFNAVDELIPNIAFEQETPSGYQLVDSNNLKNQFVILALKHTEPLIKKLRQQHLETIRTLETRYSECDEQLAKHFEFEANDTKKIIELTKEACLILKEMIPLVRSANFPKLLHFHELTARALQKRSLASIDTTASSQAKVNEPDNAKEKFSLKDEFSLQNKVKTPSANAIYSTGEVRPDEKESPVKQSKSAASSELELELNTLSTQFEMLTKAPIENQAKKIEALLAKTYEISLIYEHQIKVRDLHQLQKIRRGIQALGANLLPSLLFHNEFESAALLTSFHYLLRAEKFLNVALQTQNIKMLDFILTHSEIDINNQPVSVHKIPYPSAVHACFYGDSPSKPMSKCLSVLIKHGASLFAPDNKGLPLVYSILTGDTHSLRDALFTNRDKTIESIAFFKKLIAILKAYLAQEGISASDASSIESELHHFEFQLEALQSIQMNDPSSRYVMKRINHLEERYLQSMLGKLRKDPEVVALNQKTQKAASELLSNLNSAQLRQAKINLANNLENLDKFLEKIDAMSLGFDVIKSEVLKSLNNNLQLIEKKSRLIEVQKELVKRPAFHNRLSKQQRELLTEQSILLQEIKELEGKNPLTQDLDQLNRFMDTLESLTQIQDSAKGMGSLLTQFSSLFSSLADASKALSTNNADSPDLEQLEALLKKAGLG